MTLALLLILAQAAGYPIGGTVVHSVTGEPVKGVRLTLRASMQSTVLAVVTTQADGRFHFDGLPAGKYSLTADRNGYVPQWFGQRSLGAPVITGIVVGEGRDCTDLRFRLLPSAAIKGIVTDEKGEPVAGMSVSAFQRRGAGAAQRLQFATQAPTNDLGQYRLHSLPGGDFLVAVKGKPWHGHQVFDASGAPGGYAPTFHPGVEDAAKAAWVKVSPGETARADVRMRVVKTVELRGELKGIPVPPGSFANLQKELTHGSFLTAVPSVLLRTGRLVFPEVAPGLYTLTVMASEQKMLCLQKVAVEGDPTVVEIDANRMARVRVQLVVTGGREGQMIVAGLEAEDKQWGSVMPAGAQGQVDFGLVPAGRYSVMAGGANAMERFTVSSVSAQGARLKGEMVEIPESGGVKLNVAVDAQAAEVSGTVFNDGRPLAGVIVMLIPRRKDAGAVSYRMDQSDSDGSFTWRGVSAGEYLAFAFEEGQSWDCMDEGVMRALWDLGQPLYVIAGQKEKVRLELTRPRQ